MGPGAQGEETSSGQKKGTEDRRGEAWIKHHDHLDGIQENINNNKV